jgi:hypothetical protein
MDSACPVVPEPSWLAYTTHHGHSTNRIACPLTPQEREYVLRELDILFGTLPSAADGFQPWSWRGGPHNGQPTIPQLQTMVDRGLMDIRTGAPVPKAFFTKSGLAPAAPRLEPPLGGPAEIHSRPNRTRLAGHS